MRRSSAGRALVCLAGSWVLLIQTSTLPLAQTSTSVEALMGEYPTRRAVECVGVLEGWARPMFEAPDSFSGMAPEEAALLADFAASYRALIDFYVAAAAEDLVGAGIPRQAAEEAIVRENQRRADLVDQIWGFAADPPDDGNDYDGAIRTVMVAVGSCLTDACQPAERPPAGEACSVLTDLSRRP